MDKMLFVPAGESRSELTVKRSKFISQCFPLSNEKEAKEIIKKLREEHPGARHVVHAFVIGAENSQLMGMSDDGEPKGTAGKPVLQILKGSGLTNILCTVVRYFGGTLLGTGGLVKAYSQSAKDAVELIEKKELTNELPFSLSVSYELYEMIKHIMGNFKITIISEKFEDKIQIEGKVSETDYPLMTAAVTEATGGKVHIV